MLHIDPNPVDVGGWFGRPRRGTRTGGIPGANKAEPLRTQSDNNVNHNNENNNVIQTWANRSLI